MQFAARFDQLVAQLPQPGQLPPELESAQLRARFEQHLHAYLHQAEHSRRGNPRAQLLAWYHLRIECRPAEEVAERLGVSNQANGGRPTIWKWAQRGAALIRALAHDDTDPDRAQAMLRAAAA